MTEDVKTEVFQEETAQPEFTDIEHRAMDMGWRPKEEFNGSEDDFIDAKEFVRRKPLFEKIEAQGKQLKNAIKTLEAFKLHYGKVQETEYQRALTTLKSERKLALENGDGEKFEQLDDEIKEVEKHAEEVRAVATTPVESSGEDHPTFQSWKQRNGWYSNDEDMRAYADGLGTRLQQKGMAPEDVLSEVEKKVKEVFPTKFTNQNKRQAPNVNSSTERPSRNANELVSMSSTEKAIMDQLVSSGTITKEAYLADFKKINERTKRG